MSHFGVVAPPFFSHFRALQSLAGVLIDRGHSVTFLQQADAARWLSDPRVGFAPLGAHSHPPGSLAPVLQRAANPGGPLGLRRVINDLASSTRMLGETLPAAIEQRRIDVLLCDQMEAAGGLVAEALQLPFVSVACALPVNREAGIPLPVMPFGYEDSSRARHMYQSSCRVYDWMMGPHRKVIARLAAQLGLARRDSLHECLSPRLQLSQTVASLDFPRSALPACFHHLGPLRDSVVPSEAAAPAPPLPLDGRRRFVFASLGTLQGGRVELFKRIAAAARRLDVQLLVAHCGGLLPHQEAAVRSAGATWVTDFADQGAVLQQADAVISHAGFNTVIDAIASHVPILALPIAFDQPGVAARVAYTGVGLRASSRSSVRSLSKQLARVLEPGQFDNALRWQAGQLTLAGGAPRGAHLIDASLSGASVS